MEVREMEDPEAVELLRQARDRHFEPPKPHPTRLEPTPRERRRDAEPEPCPGSSAEVLRRARAQTSSFAKTGSTETTCRLNLSSDSSSPAATPTSCERWRIGIWKSRPVAAASFCCQASSERWQSGHGVTIASAPASFACSIGWMSSPSAVSSRAAMIGKPQHLILAG